MMYTFKNVRRVAFLAIIVLLLGACTSSLVLGTAYNAAAEKMADRVTALADFDTAQRQWIEQSFQSFQQWHRVSELPAYSALLNDIAGTLQSDQSVTQKQLDQWFDTVQQRSKRARECSPLSGSTEFLREMKNWQIQQLHKKLKSRRLEQYKKYKADSPEERRERRREMIITWSSRAGVKMTEQQQLELDETLSRQTSMGDRRFQLWDNWTDEFIALLETRSSEQFPARIQSHIDSLWNMTERNYPEEWKQNRQLWQGFVHSLLNELSANQKKSLVENITSVSKSANALSKKKSRATPVCYRD